MTTNRRKFIMGSAAAGLAAGFPRQAPAAHTSNAEKFDYIVVGAGSSGSVVANRLTEDADVNVLLLEAGGPDNHPLVKSFTRFIELWGTKLDWQYQTEPEPHLDGRQVIWPRGKVMGGSSSINAMIYIRGHRLDYDHWNYLGNAGWSYQDVLPYFKKSENNESIVDEYHGRGGLLNVSSNPIQSRFGPAFIEAARTLEFQGSTGWDFNGEVQEGGAGIYQHTIKNGNRHSTAAAFLTPFLSRSNLIARPWSFVTRVLFEGNRAVGVEYSDRDGKLTQVRAEREIILSAGAIDSPQLLMLSGVGPSSHLRSHGISVTADLSGVGKNLQDHPALWPAFTSRIPVENKQAIGTGGLFLRTVDGLKTASPNLQLLPYFSDNNGDYPAEPNLGIGLSLVRPHSVGSISLRGPDPLAAPVIRANYLDSATDLRALLHGIELARELANSSPLKELLGDELQPFRGRNTASEVRSAVKENLTTTYHPVGTCKMGHDRDAVVDPQLRVYGVEGLRVVDASIMPTIVNGNTNAPCIMIGEKAADMIRNG